MKEELRTFGLNDNEIRVYKACLELGSSSVTIIAKRAKIYRTLCYEVLKSLSEKGLVSYLVKEKKKFFEAASPKKFIQILKEKENAIKNILPEMISIQGQVKTKPSITMYEGKEGIKTVMEQLLEETKKCDAFSTNIEMKKLLKHYFPNFVERRKKAEIKIRLLLDSKPITRYLLKYKIIKKKFETGFWLYNNKVLIINFEEKEPIAIVIENKSYKKTMQIMFDIAWKTSK